MPAGAGAARPAGLRALTAGFTAGVIAVHLLPALPAFPVLAALAGAGLAPWLLPRRAAEPWRTVWAATVLGVLFTTLRAGSLLDQRWPAARTGEDAWVEGRVASLPDASGTGESRSLRFVLEPVAQGLPHRIRVAWYRTDAAVQGGECRRLLLRLRTPHGSLNPGGFDYEGWLARSGVGAVGTVRDAAPCERAAPLSLAALRQRVVNHLRGALGERAGAAMIAALTVGDTSAFTDADWDAFRATGTSHLVAISGFNIALMAGVAFFLGRWTWSVWPPLLHWLPAQRAALWVSGAAAGVYALLAGFEPPVQRAVLMLWILLAAAWTHRLAQASQVLALAWLACLLLDPLAITAPGLWLSFGAVAAIFYVSLGRSARPGFWHGALWLQLLIAVALAPLTLFFFQGASWVAPLVNVAAVPLFAVLTPWAAGALALEWIWPAAGTPLLQGAGWTAELFTAGLHRAALLPQLWLPAAPGWTSLLAATFGVMLLFAPRGVPLRPLGLLCFLPLAMAPPIAPRGGFEVTALDVGQGLAVVVRTAHHALVYDAGPAFADGFDAGESVVAPWLLRAGLRRVDALLLSHGDNDHAGGVPALRRVIAIDREIGTERGAPCRDGLRWEWDGVRFATLHPDATAQGDNDRSCVLRVDGAFSVLLPGDIEAQAEQRLLRDHPAELRADVLVAPHHGSRTSSTPAFVAAVHPSRVLHAAGWRNHFRHPRPEVVARYGAIGAEQFVTGTSGALSLWRDARGTLRAEEYRKVGAKFWNAAPGD
ncbi:MAG TPA: DNA internalization-related competence protein ComEC/Rec2 [Candidatus Binatia bacterium]|nr:DNA internalization-related competence protein ComEC/Rec2 [Candidatus Binatia bacterium]